MQFSKERELPMLMSETRAWLEIDLHKISHNIREIKALIPKKSKIMAIVKANAYGHGDIACSKELEQCGIDFFGVSSIDEALALRKANIQKKILILGYTPPTHFHYLHEENIIQTIISSEYANKLNAYGKVHNQLIKAHIKVDTGMSRLGVIAQAHAYNINEIKALYHLSNVHVCGIFSHFSASDSLVESQLTYTQNQIQLFDRILKDLKKANIDVGETHLQNSYGILNYQHLAYDYVRPGLLWMGLTSNDEIPIKSTPRFQPIMQCKANVSCVKTIQKGVSVSYGRKYQAPSQRIIATLSIGYADGYPRCVSNRSAYVLLHGKKANIIGNICMDQMMIDVSDIHHVKEGDIATLFGYDQNEFLSIDTLTRLSETINNETLCWMSARLPRIYK